MGCQPTSATRSDPERLRERLTVGRFAMNCETLHLILDVAAGNPGASTIICDLMLLPMGVSLLHHLKTIDLIGSELWRVVNDDYHGDLTCFVQDQRAQMLLPHHL